MDKTEMSPAIGTPAETSESADGSQSQVDQASLGRNAAVDEGTNVEKVLNLAAQDDNAEAWDIIQHKSRQAQFDHIGKEILKKEKENGDLRRRSKQAVLHVTFTEIRITELETELRKLKAKIQGLPDDFKLSEIKKQCPVYEHVLKRSVHGEFLLTTHSTDIPIHQRPSLEVLVTDSIPQPGVQEDPQTPFRRSTGLLDIPAHQIPERLRIRSLPLLIHLGKICRETMDNGMVWASASDGAKAAPVVLLRPFKLLFAYEKEIRESVQDVETLARLAEQSGEGDNKKKGTFRNFDFEHKDLLADLKILIEFLDVDLNSTFVLRQSIRDGTATYIEYADLWHLFELGDVVVSHSKEAQAFRVLNITGGRDTLIPRLPRLERNVKVSVVDGFVVDCCSICFDGTDYVPRMETFSIRKFIGRRPITSLEVYPLKFDENWETMQQELLSRGRRYLELTRSPFAHKMFKGKTLDEPAQELDGQVIVDIALAVNTVPDRKPTRRIREEDFTQNDLRETRMAPFCHHDEFDEGCCGSDYTFKDLDMTHSRLAPFRRDYGGLLGPRRAQELKEEDLIVLPNWVYGFVLRNRQWATVKIDDLSDVRFENNFDELMLSPSYKETILALVENRESALTAPAAGVVTIGAALDLVKGKATGLIILLHGEPGVGKTSTAECVADKTKRPLFPITCGDIGETAMEVEKNLHHNFRLAHKWGCVLLLDEADVFLAKRNKTDLRRNAVTSIFLRSLEYYAGILFLTTNRVGGIDPAFKSRIHLSLYYSPLDLDMTRKLYEVFLRRARAEQQKAVVAQFKIKDKEILRFAERHFRQLKKEGFNTWNGRQIRNAFQTAIALVEYEVMQNGPGQSKPELGKAQFKRVAEGSKEFDNYLRKTLQGADDEIAIRDQWRDDHFDTRAAPTLSTWKTAQKVSSESDSESDSSDDESETEDKYEEGDGIGAEPERGASTTGAKTESKRRVEGGVDLDDYEEFLRFKALKGKGKKTKKT